MYYVLPLPAFTRRHDCLNTVSSLLIKVDPCSQNQHDVVIKCIDVFFHVFRSNNDVTGRVTHGNDLIKLSFREHVETLSRTQETLSALGYVPSDFESCRPQCLFSVDLLKSGYFILCCSTPCSNFNRISSDAVRIEA